MSVYHHIRQLVVKEFFQQCLIFLENDKNWFSFVFTKKAHFTYTRGQPMIVGLKGMFGLGKKPCVSLSFIRL